MPIALPQRHVVRVLFHTDRSPLFSHEAGAAALERRDFDVAVHRGGPLTEALAGADVLVVSPRSTLLDRHTSEDGPAPLSGDELDAITAFVARGGGLLVFIDSGPVDADAPRVDTGRDELLGRFGLRIERGDASGEAAAGGSSPMRIVASLDEDTAEPALHHLVGDVRLHRAGRLAAVRHSEGRVAAVAGSGLFDDASLAERDHLQLWLNLFYWVAAPAFRAEPEPIVSAAAHDPAWARLRDETNALRRLQEPKGEVDLDRHERAKVEAHVAAMTESIVALAPRFPHEQAYLEQVPRDLRAWVDGGCGKPDFTASLALFHPEQHRRDGIEHLVVFPLYTPNGSPDTRFEALLVRTPWPEFVATLERSGFDNDKYVPVQLIDNTAGYDSECAVLFPETVSVAGRPTNNYGGIFCDREASRFQRSTAAGAEVLRIDLPPDVAALISNGDLVRETYILWDMVHDRWHSHGDLPFDPFMIRQRLPYWMYSLEELRVDLATYGSAGELVRDGFPFARYVQYAILFDRILRFPITGNRVRNYDGLGGQLLFAYLHQNGVVRWTDNRLLIDWERIEGAVGGLRAALDDLYRRGIDLSRVSYWIDAHDLISTYVRPNVSSQWRRDQRVITDEAETRAWIDRVLDDEFPLSIFYEQLTKKLAARAADELVAA